MQKYIAAAKALSDELEQLHTEEPDITNRTTKAAKRIRKTLTMFRRRISVEGFKSEEEEIHFFKYVKPRVSSYLIFFLLLAEIEEQRLFDDKKEVQSCIDKKQRWFRYMMKENQEFVRYYRLGLTHTDRIYFLRGKNLGALSKHSSKQQDDPEFNTSHDYIAANIMAFDLFQKYLSPKPEFQGNFGSPLHNLKWTGNRLDLVELIYALQASGSINYGEAELKDICSFFETGFKIQIGDLYRAFHDISNRKKEQVKFVNRFGEFLERKIEELDN